jgi:hypothetical protein
MSVTRKTIAQCLVQRKENNMFGIEEDLLEKNEKLKKRIKKLTCTKSIYDEILALISDFNEIGIKVYLADCNG